MSVINPESRVIFVHVPKTAGTSMEKRPFLGGSGHATARGLGIKRDCGTYFSFGFVRHPADRLLSTYTAAKARPKNWPHIEAARDFEAFVLDFLERDSRKMVHTIPQYEFLCDHRGRILVKFVGRYEKLEKDWFSACKRACVKRIELPKTNSFPHPPWREVFTEPMRAVVERVYKKDFEIFHYNAWA